MRYLCAGFAGLLLAQAAGAAEPAPEPTHEHVRSLTSAYNASGHDLFTQFVATPGNIVFSPYSIGAAMAMVLAGAHGDTEREMVTVLRHSLSPTAIDAANTRVLAILNGYDKSSVPAACPAPAMHFNGSECETPAPPNGTCAAGYPRDERCVAPGRLPPSATLKAANALMLLKPNGNLISAAYMARLADKYGAQVFRDADLAMVNGWVDRQTAGKIHRILDQIDPDAPTVILNAVYFKAIWATPFIVRATRDDDFKLTPTSRVRVPTMHRLGYFVTIARPGFRAIRLPYSVSSLAMVVVMPDAIDGTDKLARDLDGPALAALFADLTQAQAQNVDLALPRFKTGFRAEVGKLFQQAGMRRAFNAQLADFSGMTGEPPAVAPLAITGVIHRAVIDVTEQGTEAAAATAVAMVAASMPSHIEPFVVDRPFLFYIVDEGSGAILFQGRISDPRAP
ncbi:MAG TPA: serpin family protein [Xanthobacteraceae bacterium]|nr:serpin family protein [Xanthobacteraceae bacterium]